MQINPWEVLSYEFLIRFINSKRQKCSFFWHLTPLMTSDLHEILWLLCVLTRSTKCGWLLPCNFLSSKVIIQKNEKALFQKIKWVFHLFPVLGSKKFQCHLRERVVFNQVDIFQNVLSLCAHGKFEFWFWSQPPKKCPPNASVASFYYDSP